MKSLIIFIAFLSAFQGFSQEITGKELLEKSIKFHDSRNNWSTFDGEFFVTMKTPEKVARTTKIKINIPKEYFLVIAERDSITTEYAIHKTDCSIFFNGKENPSEAIKKEHSLSCERAKLLKNYYTFLYGLPMKLKDNGTIIHEKVERKMFQEKEYLVLKVSYDQSVGKDTWYFYFNPYTYALEVYQFFKDETKNDGEYILLSDLETINHIKMPKNRAWYYNKNDEYLGTDVLSRNNLNR
jgi:hypothetical protein